MMGNTMTAARQQRKLPSRGPRIGPKISPSTGPRPRPRIGLALAALVSAGLGLAGPIAAAATERTVVDPNSGLAISGFDPVAYFTDAKVLPGKDEFEQVF